MQQRSLSGNWEFRFDDDANWTTLPVPGCWEILDVPKDRSGPAWSRKEVSIPPEFAGTRLWLKFGGVSYSCVVCVNGQECGRHVGLWDAFAVEITSAVGAATTADVRVLVEKPASLTQGPGSPPVPGTYPMAETLSAMQSCAV